MHWGSWQKNAGASLFLSKWHEGPFQEGIFLHFIALFQLSIFVLVPPEFTLLGHVSLLPQSQGTARDQGAATRVSHSRARPPEFAIALKQLPPPCSATDNSSSLAHIRVK